MDIAPAKPKCIFVLSTKSAGSSALQQLFCKLGDGHHVAHAQHGALNWAKTASVLGLSRVNLPNSEVAFGSGLLVVRYEDFSSKPDTAEALIEGFELAVTAPTAGAYVHASSGSRWKAEDSVHFQLDPQVADAARRSCLPQPLAATRCRLWAVPDRIAPMARTFRTRNTRHQGCEASRWI